MATATKATKATKSTRTTKATAAKAQPRKATATKAVAKAAGNARFGKAEARKVVTMRDKGRRSWAQIGTELGFAPRTARRLYDSVKGAGAHHGLLEGKGGRTPVAS